LADQVWKKPGAYTGMATNTLKQAPTDSSASLGSFLRDRRSRLQPATNAPGRRRTPGLRREEVAARAAVSVTWYTWLEQGRGGSPSEEVLERLARALELDAVGREMLFFLAQQRPPPVAPGPTPAVTPTLQRVLDCMCGTAAIVKTPCWDVVAWNRAATQLLTDYSALPVRERNVLRMLFCDPRSRTRLLDWEENARFALGVFRVDVTRTGGNAEAHALAAELQQTSPEFRRLWAENEVRGHGIGHKRFQHPTLGALTLEYSAFAVDGSKGLSMIVFSPISQADARAIERLLASR
jgi:transcriptional regulator with XRE-family HTH domain